MITRSAPFRVLGERGASVALSWARLHFGHGGRSLVSRWSAASVKTCTISFGVIPASMRCVAHARSVNAARPIVTFRSESSIYRRQSVAPPLIWRIVDSSHKWFMYPSGSRTSAP